MKIFTSLRAKGLGASSVFTGLLVALAGSSAQAQNGPAKAPYVADELMVKIVSGGAASRSAVAANANAVVGAQVVRDYGNIGWQTVKLPKGLSISDAIARYKKLAGVISVEPNYIMTGQDLPNDPRLGEVYGMNKIGAPAAWNVTTGSASTIVAVVDTGVDYTHEDLAANMWKNPGEIAGNGKDDDNNGYIDDVYGIDALNNDSDPMDDNSHGTHCAGTIGAVGNNGLGVVGVNWNVKIMALKFLGATNGGTTDGAIRCLQYVTMMKNRGVNVRVISNSWGGGGGSQALKDALDAAGNAGMLNVCAASNGGDDGIGDDNDASPIYPANFDSPGLMSIAASDSNDNRGSFSNYGKTTVDLAAPGVDILSTTPGSNYGTKSGTSMATPCVSGAAALLASYKPSLTPQGLKDLLMSTVDVLPQWNNVVVTGGRLNLARALRTINPNALPVVDTVVPPTGSGVATIQVNFSKAMNRTTTAAALKFEPAINGTIAWTNTDKTLTFTSSAALPAGNSYQMRILGSASDTTGKTLDGNANNISEGTPTDDYTYSLFSGGTPSNDFFANAKIITGQTGNVSGFNVGATKETGEPTHTSWSNGEGGGIISAGNSVWYKWTAPITGNISVQAQAGFGPYVEVYEGTSVSTIQSVASSGTSSSEVRWHAIKGKTYMIVVDSLQYMINYQVYPAETGAFNLVWNQLTPPLNDNFVSAITISGGTGSVSGSNLGAYYEDGEPYHAAGRGASVWYKWTPTSIGALTVDTEGSLFNTGISIYTGTAVNALTKVAEDDDAGTGTLSYVQFSVQPGKTYYIAVDGEGYDLYAEQGNFKLNWLFTPAPANDMLAAAALVSGATGTVNGTNVGASVQASEPDHGSYSSGDSVWYKWVATGDGRMFFDTTGSAFDTTMAVYTNTSTGMTTLQKVAENDDISNDDHSSRVSWTCVSGKTYFIAIAGGDYGLYSDTHNAIKLNWKLTPAPSNDKFASAQLISTTSGSLSATNFGANLETSEPEHGAWSDYASVWYKWVAPKNGSMTFDTSGSQINTTSAVYTGTSLTALTQVADNDDVAYPDTSSRVTWTAVSGKTYYIAVATSSYNDDENGPFNLNWNFTAAPANDMFVSAQALTSTSGHLSASTFAANTEAGEPTHGYYNPTPSVWYKFTAPSNGGITVDTKGSQLDTTMGAYSANTNPAVVNNLTELATNGDQEYPDLTSRVSIAVRAGKTYYFAVACGDSYADMVEGPFNLNWNFTAAPSNDNFASAQVISGTSGRVYGSNVGAGAELNEPYHNYDDPRVSVWYKWTAPAAGDVTIDTKGSNFNTVLAAYSGTSFSNLYGEASDDDGNYPAETSTVTFTVEAGTTYYIAVDSGGYNDPEMGDVVLNWSLNGAAIRNPSISSFTPASGVAGTVVTINGTNFTGATAVKFNGVAGTIQSTTATQIKAAAPTGVSTGRISVTTAYGTATSSTDFQVAPRITSFTPSSGGASTIVTITGTSFIGVDGVQFNGAAADYVVNSATSITATVPAAATTGKITVSAASGIGTSATNFLVAPRIASFTPTSGSYGTVVTITGLNFTGATGVKFNATAATTFTVNSATEIVATVPAGTSTGKITVTTPAGSAVSTDTFTLVPAPSITSFTPTSGVAGTVVTITGKSFTGATSVKFNGVETTDFRVDSATQITVSVPAGTTSGKISVVTPGGTATSAALFTIVLPPTITSFSPAYGKTGTVVAVAGTNFVKGGTSVKFGTVAASTIVYVSAKQINVTAPVGVVTGKISVTTVAGSAESANNFTVDATAPSVTVTSPVKGSTISSLPSITGTAADETGGSGLARVELKLKRDLDGVYWNGTAWGTTTPVVLSTVVTGTNWSRSSATGLPLANSTDTTKALTDGTYTFSATAYDKVGNARAATSTFRFVAGPPPSLSVTDVTVTEGNASAVVAAFTVKLSSASSQTVTVNVATANGTTNPATGGAAAGAGIDYITKTGTLTFAPGETSKVVNVSVSGDIIDELDETFFLQLSNAVGAPISDASGLATIKDDDTSVITVTAPSVTEGNGTTNPVMTFTLKLSVANSRPVTVKAQTSNATTFPATAGVDYVALAATTVTIPAGTTTQTVNVTLKSDALDEENERIGLTLTTPVNATVGAGSEGTILDDDATPSLSISDVSISEGNTGTVTANFTVTMSAISGRTVTATYATADYTATVANNDYVAATGTVTIAPGQTRVTIPVTIKGDTVREGNDQFYLKLTGSVNATRLDGTGIGTILNDDSTGIAGISAGDSNSDQSPAEVPSANAS